jgi:hypothetical protein
MKNSCFPCVIALKVVFDPRMDTFCVYAKAMIE